MKREWLINLYSNILNDHVSISDAARKCKMNIQTTRNTIFDLNLLGYLELTKTKENTIAVKLTPAGEQKKIEFFKKVFNHVL